jgi:hypothetical protein
MSTLKTSNIQNAGASAVQINLTSSDVTFTGATFAPTVAADTNTTNIATTAFVLGQASSVSPAMDGSAAAGSSNRYARADHVHPSDTSRATVESPTFTGTVTIPTLSLTTEDSASAASHYMVEVGSDNVVRPKTLANVQSEIVTNAAVNSASATTLGTVTVGTWNGTDIGLAYGGTNASLTAVNGGVVYSTSAEMAITSAGTVGQVLTSNGAGAPTWQDASGGFNPFFLVGL